MQGETWIDVTQQLLEMVDKRSVPGDERGPEVDIDSVRVTVLVNLLLHVPIGNMAGRVRSFVSHVVGIDEGGQGIKGQWNIELPNGIDEQRPLLVRNRANVSAYLITKHTDC